MPKLNTPQRIILIGLVLAIGALTRFGCGQQEDTKLPSHGVYYTGPMLQKPKGSMVPSGPGGER